MQKRCAFAAVFMLSGIVGILPTPATAESETLNYFAIGNFCNNGLFGLLPSANACFGPDTGTTVEVRVKDVTGLPVSARYTMYDAITEQVVDTGHFCDSTTLPLPVPWVALSVQVDSYVGACLPYPGAGTFGTITATFG